MRIYLFILGAVLPLSLGSIIYLYFRDPPFFTEDSELYSFFLFTLPDAIWSFSLVVMICSIWLTPQSSFIAWIGLCIVIGISFEAGQYFNLFIGTYDTLDLIVSAIASVIAFTVSRHTINKLS